MEEWFKKVYENIKDPWAIVGFTGQALFMLRFIIQWLASEKAKKVVIPAVFWYISIVGSLITLVYVIHRKDPVFILAFSLNILIYVRNLMLHMYSNGKVEVEK